jgi:hypothetical protein
MQTIYNIYKKYVIIVGIVEMGEEKENRGNGREMMFMFMFMSRTRLLCFPHYFFT